MSDKEIVSSAEMLADKFYIESAERHSIARQVTQFGLSCYAKGNADGQATAAAELSAAKEEIARIAGMEYDVTIIDLQREILELKSTLAVFHKTFPEIFADNNFDSTGAAFLLEYEQLQFDKQNLEAQVHTFKYHLAVGECDCDREDGHTVRMDYPKSLDTDWHLQDCPYFVSITMMESDTRAQAGGK